MAGPLKTELIREKIRDDTILPKVETPHAYLKRLVERAQNQRLQVVPQIRPGKVGLLAKIKF